MSETSIETWLGGGSFFKERERTTPAAAIPVCEPNYLGHERQSCGFCEYQVFHPAVDVSIISSGYNYATRLGVGGTATFVSKKGNIAYYPSPGQTLAIGSTPSFMFSDEGKADYLNMISSPFQLALTGKHAVGNRFTDIITSHLTLSFVPGGHGSTVQWASFRWDRITEYISTNYDYEGNGMIIETRWSRINAETAPPVLMTVFGSAPQWSGVPANAARWYLSARV